MCELTEDMYEYKKCGPCDGFGFTMKSVRNVRPYQNEILFKRKETCPTCDGKGALKVYVGKQ